MIISLNLLKTFLPSLNKDEFRIAEDLTMLGHEVENIFSRNDLEYVIVAKVEKMEAITDKLTLCDINTGINIVKVVCGAKNFKLNDKVALAKVGAVIKGIKIEKRTLRDHISEGMLCSEDELNLSKSSEGIMILDKSAPLGENLYKYLFNSDVLLDLEITPNRPDALSHLGIARELAAKYSIELRIPSLISYRSEDASEAYEKMFEKSSNKEVSPSIVVAMEERKEKAALAYSVIYINNIEVKESEQWLKSYLNEFNIKSINSVVDITNFVMIELGQPVHAFDLDKSEGLYPRFAKRDEKILCLDGNEYTLSSSDIVIAKDNQWNKVESGNVNKESENRNKDAESRDSKFEVNKGNMEKEEIIALAGVMGSMESGVTFNTKRVAIEVANFDKSSIRRTSKKFNLSSEASYRFERGVAFNKDVIARVLSLLNVSDFVVKEYVKHKQEEKVFKISIHDMNDFFGFIMPKEIVIDILKRLNLFKSIHDDTVNISVPEYRLDISREVDVYEEILRVYGYNKVESIMPRIDIKQYDEERVDLSEVLISMGLNEVVNYSFVPAKWGNRKLLNPINEELAVMRDNLLYSMLKTVSYNLKNGSKEIAIFEIGKIYDKEEHDRFSIALSGIKEKRLWSDEEEYDFFYLKGVIEALAKAFNFRISFTSLKHKHFHPFRCMNIVHSGKVIGIFGEIHPAILKEFDIKKRVYFAESELFEFKLKMIDKVSKYQSVDRELALIFDASKEIGPFLDMLRHDLIVDKSIVDIYTSENIGKDKKSVAFRFKLQSFTHTLEEREIDEVMQYILSEADKVNAFLRQV